MRAAEPPGGASGQGYFYLSYAHSPPLAGSRLEPPDVRVHTFFSDLTLAVEQHSRLSHLVAGYFDQELPYGPQDRKAALERAIGAAEVFVPLYSPSYLARSWPGRELACFEQRMSAAGIPDPMQRVTPVLWIPLLAGQRPKGLRHAMELATPDAAAAYAENGLLALMRLAPYQHSYELVVDQLAKRIVGIAEAAPIGPSRTPDISQVQSRFAPASDAAMFVVAVAAPALHETEHGSNRLAYGVDGSAWRPFTLEQELSLADYSAIAAEQLDFTVHVMEIGNVDDPLFTRAPGVLLIDPLYVADEQHLASLHEVVSCLPPWVLPVVIPDVRGGSRAELLAATVRTMLKEVETRSEPARQALNGIRSLSTFVRLMPFLVVEAERQYMRNGPAKRAMTRPSRRREEEKNPASALSGPDAGWPDRLPGHAFISYVREDSTQVAQLQALLQSAGIPIWRDIDDLWPGEDWRTKIRRAITDNALVFLACFSSNSRARDTSYQNEELQLAIEELRRRRPGDIWLIPVRFSDVEVPDLEIGTGRTLQSIQRVDLFGDKYYDAAMRLVSTIRRTLASKQASASDS